MLREFWVACVRLFRSLPCLHEFPDSRVELHDCRLLKEIISLESSWRGADLLLAQILCTIRLIYCLCPSTNVCFWQESSWTGPYHWALVHRSPLIRLCSAFHAACIFRVSCQRQPWYSRLHNSSIDNSWPNRTMQGYLYHRISMNWTERSVGCRQPSLVSS